MLFSSEFVTRFSVTRTIAVSHAINSPRQAISEAVTTLAELLLRTLLLAAVRQRIDLLLSRRCCCTAARAEITTPMNADRSHVDRQAETTPFVDRRHAHFIDWCERTEIGKTFLQNEGEGGWSFLLNYKKKI